LLQHVGASTLGARILFAALLAVQHIVTGLILFIQVPYYVNLVTHAFYHALHRDEELSKYSGAYPHIPAKTRTNWVDRAFRHPWWMLAVVLAGIAAWSGVIGANFERIYRPDRDLEVVAHRAGGETMPENSISGLLWAIDIGADWVEIDVQRTKDGAYVLNHDDTFLRVAGEKRKVSELTLEEINELNIGNDKIETERVPQLEEFLQVAKDQMQVIIELKGPTANKQMADDVVELVTELEMVDQVMVMGLDYDLIKYIEATNPQITTGYCYFISLGDITQLDGDYMLLEEGEASNWRLLSLSWQHKGAMVWTVNTDRSMRQMVTRDIDAIITDRPERLQEIIAEDRDASDVELFFRIFLDIGI
ncbi:MAG: glycerophosphodiester phosphodiesterase family protein, partial [Bowdeniella nasicola]|nr:glycerophosphodiester phosphodiesterase family protein [Bowdeniella nasicola]